MTKVFLATFLTLFQLLLFGQNAEQTGLCSFYADKFQGHHTSSGELYNKNDFTAAHRTLPFNTLVEITNLRNNKKVVVRVNDRGPQTKSRVLDISKAAAITLDMVSYGVQKVSYKVVEGKTPMPLNDTILKKLAQITPTKNPVQKTVVEPADKQIFDKNLKACQPKGYGVQLGYYKSQKNCIAAMATYETKYKSEGFFFVDKKTQNTYYRLILGNLTTKQQAEALKLTIAKDIPGCFVVAWSKP